MLLREFNRSDHYLCSSYFQPIDPADLTCENTIDKCLIFILGLRSPCHAEILLRLLSILDKKPDVKKSRRRPQSAGGLLTANFQPERTACEEMMSKQLCILTKWDPMCAYGVHTFSHNLNHRWTTAIITKPRGGDIYDLSNSQTASDPRKKRSRYYPQCTTRIRWHFSRLPADVDERVIKSTNRRVT
ncbi:hypothetical protein ACTXT7_017432, partial [Hymenolepis weldensis]